MDRSCYVNRLDHNQYLLILTNIVVWRWKEQVDCLPNARVKISFQINSNSLGNIYNLFHLIRQSFWKAVFGDIFLVFHVIKLRMRLLSMESQQDHRKADTEKQTGLGVGEVFFIVLYQTKSSWSKTYLKNTGFI